MTPPHDPKDPRAAILARRAKFVAVALAGFACGKETADPPKPLSCLSVAVPQDAGPPPQPCLSQPMPQLEDASPRPCLKMVVPTPTTTPPPPTKKDQ